MGLDIKMKSKSGLQAEIQDKLEKREKFWISADRRKLFQVKR